MLADRLPDLQKSADNLKKSNDNIDEQINQMQTQLTETKLESIAIQQNIQLLRDMVVTDDQVQSVKEYNYNILS